MLEIVSCISDGNKGKSVLHYKCARIAAQNALEAIKRELPEEAQTAEAFKFIISEMEKLLKEARIIL